MAKGKADTSTPATVDYRHAVAVSKEYLSMRSISEIKNVTRRMMALRLATDAEARSLNGNWIGNRHFIAVQVRPGSLNITELISAAEWHPLAFDALGILAGRILERGDVLPDELKKWTIATLRGENAPPPMPRNQRKGVNNENMWRDIYIGQAVLELVELGMKPTRNASSAPFSACDAVADAMRELGVNPMSYSGVYAIWNTYQAME